jgi:hypothetical protein
MTAQSTPTMLVLVSRPLVDEHGRPLARLDLEGEIKLLRERLGDLDRAVEVQVQFATTDALLRWLLPPQDFDILHFSGHGGDGRLAFEDGRGMAHLVTGEDLRRLIGVAARPPTLAFLSACRSGSLADALVQTGVPHVIVIDAKASVLDPAATAFARVFYPALLAGRPLRQTFDDGLTAIRTDSDLHHLGLILEEPGLAAEEEAKFLLLPEGADHSAPLFPPTLSRGELQVHYPATTRHNLPARPETFTGRQRELHDLLEQVLDHRLVTMTGLGGMGKTTLAQEAGRWLAERGYFPDGITFVDLRELTELSGIRARTAEAAGLELSVAASDGGLAHALAGRRLLILDDLDRAAADPRGLADLLRTLCDYAAPAHLLLTTRERVSGPAPKQVPLGRLEDDEARSLFLFLANLAHDRITGYQRDLAAILAFLDGWPQAITLAARLLADYGGDLTWLRTQLETAKDQALTDPLIPADQRRKPDSLTLSLRLSYQRLVQTEPAAVRAILGPQHVAHLPRLRTLSLAEELPGGRLRLPAPARAFAERLLPADARATCGPAALTYYLALASQADDLLSGHHYFEGLAALLTELPNLESWLDWGFEREPAENAVSRAGDKEGEANTLQAIGDVQQFRDEREAALDSYQQALALFRAVGARLGEANVLLAIAPFAEKPAEAFSIAISLYESIGDRYSVARGLYYFGLWLRNQGQVDEAKAAFAQSRDLFLAINVPQAAAIVEQAM